MPGGGVPRVVQVDEQSIVGTGGYRGANQRRGPRGLHFISLGAQEKFESFEHVLLVVGCQYAGTFVAALRGNGRKYSGLGGSLHGQLLTRGADRITNRAAHRILKLDAIMFQSRPGCPIEFNFCFFKDGHRGHQIELCQ